MSPKSPLLEHLLRGSECSLRDLSFSVKPALAPRKLEPPELECLARCSGLRSVRADVSCVAALSGLTELVDLTLVLREDGEEVAPPAALPSLRSLRLHMEDRGEFLGEFPWQSGVPAWVGSLLLSLCLAAPGLTTLEARCCQEDHCVCEEVITAVLPEVLAALPLLQSVKLHVNPDILPLLQSQPRLTQLDLNIRCPFSQLDQSHAHVQQLQLAGSIKGSVRVVPIDVKPRVFHLA